MKPSQAGTLESGDIFIQVFPADTEGIEIELDSTVAYQFGDATQVAFANALRGIGRSMPVMRIAFVSYVAVGIPLLYVLAFTVGWGIAGIYAGFVVALLMTGVLLAQSFYSALRRQHRYN